MESTNNDKLSPILNAFRDRKWFLSVDYRNLETEINDMMFMSGSQDRYLVEGAAGTVHCVLMQANGVAVGQISFEEIEAAYGIKNKKFKNSNACFKLWPNSLRDASRRYDGIIISVCPRGEWNMPTSDQGRTIMKVSTLENFHNFYMAVQGNIAD